MAARRSGKTFKNIDKQKGVPEKTAILNIKNTLQQIAAEKTSEFITNYAQVKGNVSEKLRLTRSEMLTHLEQLEKAHKLSFQEEQMLTSYRDNKWVEGLESNRGSSLIEDIEWKKTTPSDLSIHRRDLNLDYYNLLRDPKVKQEIKDEIRRRVCCEQRKTEGPLILAYAYFKGGILPELFVKNPHSEQFDWDRFNKFEEKQRSFAHTVAMEAREFFEKNPKELEEF